LQLIASPQPRDTYLTQFIAARFRGGCDGGGQCMEPNRLSGSGWRGTADGTVVVSYDAFSLLSSVGRGGILLRCCCLIGWLGLIGGTAVLASSVRIGDPCGGSGFLLFCVEWIVLLIESRRGGLRGGFGEIPGGAKVVVLSMYAW